MAVAVHAWRRPIDVNVGQTFGYVPAKSFCEKSPPKIGSLIFDFPHVAMLRFQWQAMASHR